MEKQFSYETENVKKPYITIGIVHMKNGCCNDQPVLLTVNYSHNWKDHINYSCQCGCGGWCTNGHGTASEALKEYEDMTTKSLERRRMK